MSFESLADKYFGKPARKRGFKKIDVGEERHECWVDYENETTRFSVHYEIGSALWIVIADAKNPQNNSSLEWLLIELGEEKAPTVEEAYAYRFPSDKLESLLEEKSRQLFLYADDLLRGDFAILPRLQELGRKFAVERERYEEEKR